MKIELRERLRADHITRDLGAVLTSESEAESKIIDEVFGKKVNSDGLIARRLVEVRLSDGYREHYIHVVPDGLNPESLLRESLELLGHACDVPQKEARANDLIARIEQALRR